MKGKSQDTEVVLGVDTHLDVHVGVVLSASGQLLGTRSVSVSFSGYVDLLTWSKSFGMLRRAGVEGTGTYGAALCRYLSDEAVTVFEVNRPDRSKRRLAGKSDPIDAENARVFKNLCQTRASVHSPVVSVA